MMTLSSRLYLLAAPHRTDRLQVLKQEDVPFGFWLKAAQALKLPPNPMSRSMTHRYQHSDTNVPGFPDRLEVCLGVDGHEGFQARAWHNGKITDFEGSSPYRPWVPTKLNQWPPRAKTRPTPNNKGIGSDRDADAARSEILDRLMKLLRNAFKAYAPTSADVSYLSPVPEKTFYRGRECVFFGPEYRRHWLSEDQWDHSKHRVSSDVPELWKELTTPLRSAWAEFEKELTATLQGTWEIVSRNDEQHGVTDPAFVWTPKIVMLPNSVLLHDEPEVLLNSLTTLAHELPRMVRPFQEVAMQTRAEDMGTDVETQHFLHAYVVAAVQNGPTIRRLLFTNVQAEETGTEATLQFPGSQSPTLSDSSRWNQGYEYLSNKEWSGWLKEWEGQWEDLLPEKWDTPEFSASVSSSEPKLILSIPHGADVPVSLARKAGKLAGSQFKDYLRLVEKAYESYQEHKALGEEPPSTEDREDEDA